MDLAEPALFPRMKQGFLCLRVPSSKMVLILACLQCELCAGEGAPASPDEPGLRVTRPPLSHGGCNRVV